MADLPIVSCPMCGTDNTGHRCTHCGEQLRSPLPPLGNRERTCDLCGQPVQFYLPLTLAANDCERCEGEGVVPTPGNQKKSCRCLSTAKLCARCRDGAIPVLPLMQSPGFYSAWSALGYLLFVLSLTLWALNEFTCLGVVALLLAFLVTFVVDGTESLIRALFRPEERYLQRHRQRPRFQQLLELLRTRNTSIVDTNEMLGAFAPKINHMARSAPEPVEEI